MIRKTPLRSVGKKKPRMWACAHCRIKNEGAARRCVSCSIGRATKRTSLKARADALARELCRVLADGKCARCGGPGSDWAHRFPRRHHSLRWSMDNCDFLCRSCHNYFGSHPVAFMRWLTDRIGYDRAQALEAVANSAWDKDYARVIAELRAALAAKKEAA